MEIVNVFRKSEYVVPIIRDAIKIRAKAVWLQDGIISEEASIIAKETREREIKKIKNEIGDFGSGYPSDKRTIKFLKAFYGDNHKWPTGARKSWKTLNRIKPVKTLDDFGENNE
mgnify:CR=1 FL=1